MRHSTILWHSKCIIIRGVKEMTADHLFHSSSSAILSHSQWLWTAAALFHGVSSEEKRNKRRISSLRDLSSQLASRNDAYHNVTKAETGWGSSSSALSYSKRYRWIHCAIKISFPGDVSWTRDRCIPLSNS